MLKARNFQIIGATVLIIVAMFATISANRPSTATTIDAAAYPDYAGRHPGMNNPSFEKALGSDFYQRQSGLGNISVAKDAGLSGSDYYERQAGMGNLAVGKKVNLSWPPRPDFSVLNKKVDLSWPPRPDFSILNQNALIPITGNQVASDYFERHSELIGRTVTAADLSDYSLRHPEMTLRAGAAADLSDFSLRHPGMTINVGAAADLSDYSLRHPDLFQATSAADTSDYFLRH